MTSSEHHLHRSVTISYYEAYFLWTLFTVISKISSWDGLQNHCFICLEAIISTNATSIEKTQPWPNSCILNDNNFQVDRNGLKNAINHLYAGVYIMRRLHFILLPNVHADFSTNRVLMEPTLNAKSMVYFAYFKWSISILNLQDYQINKYM